MYRKCLYISSDTALANKYDSNREVLLDPPACEPSQVEAWKKGTGKPMSVDKLSILIADDHTLVRDAVAAALVRDGGFNVQTVGSFGEALSLVAEGGAFDVLILDVNMPGMNGLSSVKNMVSANRDGAVVLFSGSLESEFVRTAIQLGARGFLPKSLPLKSLVSIIRMISTGQEFVPATIALDAADSWAPDKSPLSRKETAVLREAWAGDTNKEIARKMNLTEVTVKMHMRAICQKLGAKNRTQAAILGQKLGIVGG